MQFTSPAPQAYILRSCSQNLHLNSQRRNHYDSAEDAELKVTILTMADVHKRSWLILMTQVSVCMKSLDENYMQKWRGIFAPWRKPIKYILNTSLWASKEKAWWEQYRKRKTQVLRGLQKGISRLMQTGRGGIANDPHIWERSPQEQTRFCGSTVIVKNGYRWGNLCTDNYFSKLHSVTVLIAQIELLLQCSIVFFGGNKNMHHSLFA